MHFIQTGEKKVRAIAGIGGLKLHWKDGCHILNKRLRTLKAQISEMEREYMENVAKRSYERLDNLDIQIHEKEQEYQEIAEIIKQEEKQWNR